jgi:hypothetical protein
VSDQVGGMDSATVTVTINSAGSNRLSTPVKLDATHYLLTYSGISSAKYALEWTGNLRPPIAWTPQATNTAAADGLATFTNQQLASSGFWRIRYVP